MSFFTCSPQLGQNIESYGISLPHFKQNMYSPLNFYFYCVYNHNEYEYNSIKIKFLLQLLIAGEKEVFNIISYRPLWDNMENKKVSQYKLLQSVIDNKTLDRLKKNQNFFIFPFFFFGNIFPYGDFLPFNFKTRSLSYKKCYNYT